MAVNVIKSNKFNQCDFASFQAGDLRRNMKTHSGERPKNAASVTEVGLPKKNGIFWEFFPKWGGVTPIPKTFVKLPSHFWHAKFILRC